mmetsp:Transcript_41727/g.56886  ORF Transcript_41727/g.56886 Transcript_41727/m.56886 type:complete len:272 (+) Transcript_41727:174-989(+)
MHSVTIVLPFPNAPAPFDVTTLPDSIEPPPFVHSLTIVLPFPNASAPFRQMETLSNCPDFDFTELLVLSALSSFVLGTSAREPVLDTSGKCCPGVDLSRFFDSFSPERCLDGAAGPGTYPASCAGGTGPWTSARRRAATAPRPWAPRWIAASSASSWTVSTRLSTTSTGNSAQSAYLCACVVETSEAEEEEASSLSDDRGLVAVFIEREPLPPPAPLSTALAWYLCDRLDTCSVPSAFFVFVFIGCLFVDPIPAADRHFCLFGGLFCGICC